MILRHYSSSPFTFDPQRIYMPDPGDFKPVGLWLSDESDHGWKAWCEGEEYNLSGLVHAVDFELRPDANVLHIASRESLRAFTRWYSKAVCGTLRCIDWARVAAEYDGIVISPYQWQSRLDHDVFWYYSWDCASACIWNLEAIEVVGVTA